MTDNQLREIFDRLRAACKVGAPQGDEIAKVGGEFKRFFKFHEEILLNKAVDKYIDSQVYYPKHEKLDEIYLRYKQEHEKPVEYWSISIDDNGQFSHENGVYQRTYSRQEYLNFVEWEKEEYRKFCEANNLPLITSISPRADGIKEHIEYCKRFKCGKTFSGKGTFLKPMPDVSDSDADLMAAMRKLEQNMSNL